MMRPFAIRDLSQVYDLACGALSENYSLSIFEEIYPYWPEAFIVLEDGERIIGFIFGIMMSRSEARVLMLAISPEYRMRGLGTLLYRAFEKEASNKGIHQIVLEVRITNLPAIRFYQKLGFQVTGRIDHYYTNGEDAYRMTAFL